MLTRCYRWIADTPHNRTGVRVLQGLIGAAVLFRLFTEWRFALYFWGPHGLGSVSAGWLQTPLTNWVLAMCFGSPLATYLVLLILGIGATLLLAGTRTRLGTALTLIGFIALEQRLPDILDGGDNIMRLALIFLLFTIPTKREVKPGSLQVWLHNIAVIAIILQLCVLYETSGMMKAYGERWHNGTAMYYIMQVSWLSLPRARGAFKSALVTMVSTYAPMFYQVLFPVAILSRLRVLWVATGVLFHIGIAILMGLVSFSMAMTGLELLLINDNEYASIRTRARAIVATIQQRTPWRQHA